MRRSLLLLIGTGSALTMAPILYCKPGKDGKSIGDCPFTQYSRMAMEVAGKTYEVRPTAKDAKPQWLLDNHGGSMPCLAMDETGTGAVSESSKIASNALPPTDGDTASLDATSSLFGAIAKFLKNTDDAKDPELLVNLETALSKLDDRLKVVTGPYLSNAETLGLADCSVATKLFVLQVAGNHFKKFTVDPVKFPNVSQYMTTVFDSESFLKTKYSDDDMIFGWSQARSGGH